MALLAHAETAIEVAGSGMIHVGFAYQSGQCMFWTGGDGMERPFTLACDLSSSQLEDLEKLRAGHEVTVWTKLTGVLMSAEEIKPIDPQQSVIKDGAQPGHKNMASRGAPWPMNPQVTRFTLHDGPGP